MATKAPPDLDELRRIYDYDPATGHLIWRERPGADMTTVMWNGRCAGRVAGKIDSHGYVQTRIGPVQYLAHRLCWMHFYGEWPEGWLDHIDGNPLNNSIHNLRLTTASGNAANKRIRSDSLSGIKGVSFHRASGKWIARVQKDGKRRTVGYYSNPEDAAAAYAVAAEKLHGEFARVA